MKLTANTILAYTNFNSLTNTIMDLAQEILPDKVVYLNFLNEEVQVTMRVSKHDTKVRVQEGFTIPVDEAICGQLDYEAGTSVLISDTQKNNFSEKVNKTINDLNIGSYLGIPILFKDGTRFGTLCAAHHEEGEFSQREVKLLENIAYIFSLYLELESSTYRDVLTNLQNKQFLYLKEDFIVKNGGLLVMLDLDNFKLVNDTFGHDVGDEVLKEVGRKIEKLTAPFYNSIAIRLGGDEFIIYVAVKTEEEARALIEQLLADLRVWETPIGDIVLTSSVGAFMFTQNSTHPLADITKHVDRLLYKAKRNGKNTYVLEKIYN